VDEASIYSYMIDCRHPSAAAERVARTWLQRFIYSEIYLCVACGARLCVHHPLISAVIVNNYRFLFSRYSHCLTCGSGAVGRNDRIYFLSRNPLAWIQWLVGAPLMECSPCGRQYFDWRAARPRNSNVTATAETSRDLLALSQAIPRNPYSPGSDSQPEPDQTEILERSLGMNNLPGGARYIFRRSQSNPRVTQSNEPTGPSGSLDRHKTTEDCSQGQQYRRPEESARIRR
jgi:hypothetical protein